MTMTGWSIVFLSYPILSYPILVPPIRDDVLTCCCSPDSSLLGACVVWGSGRQQLDRQYRVGIVW